MYLFRRRTKLVKVDLPQMSNLRNLKVTFDNKNNNEILMELLFKFISHSLRIEYLYLCISLIREPEIDKISNLISPFEALTQLKITCYEVKIKDDSSFLQDLSVKLCGYAI